MNDDTIVDDDQYAEYQRLARRIRSSEKRLFCPTVSYVFYGELELNLNGDLRSTPREQWSLLFVEYDFLPPMYFNTHDFPSNNSSHIFFFPAQTLNIISNAKIKYSCLDCQLEWTTARGRAMFQAEIPEENKYNIVFSYLYTQECRQCRQEIQPSWYLDEATRVIKQVCRIFKKIFYPHRQWETIVSSDDDQCQRQSEMRTIHQQKLCRACQVGSCFGSNWKRR